MGLRADEAASSGKAVESKGAVSGAMDSMLNPQTLQVRGTTGLGFKI